MLVVAFHAGLPIPSGGLVGVTLFFVLSGYLITSLLIREWAESGSVDLARFFARRSRRLLPALIVVVGTVTVVGLLSGRATAAVQDALLSLAYVANWARAYGDPMGLLNHIWSLSIEAQFYVLWPFALVLFARRGLLHGRVLVAVLMALVIGSTALRSILVEGGADSGRIYFGTDVRADALLAGCALALLVARSTSIDALRPIGALALVALAMVSMMPTLDPLWSNSAYSFATVASVGVVLAALHPDQRWTGLTIGPLRWIGERSYSLYLVHVPVMMVVGATLSTIDPILRGVAAVAMSVVLSVALYRFVEMPFRRHHAVPDTSIGRRDLRPAPMHLLEGFARPRKALPDAGQGGALS